MSRPNKRQRLNEGEKKRQAIAPLSVDALLSQQEQEHQDEGEIDTLATTTPDAQQPKQKSKSPSSSRSLFVRGLHPSFTTEQFTNLFAQDFPVKHATVVSDPTTKLSKGYGFVTLADAEDAVAARDKFQGHVVETPEGGRKKIQIELAKSRQRRGADGENLETSNAADAEAPNVIDKAARDADRQLSTSSKLIVRNLPWSIKTEDQLAHLFRSYGKIKQATLPPRKGAKRGLSSGFGFVLLRGRKNAERALASVNGKEVDGRTLAVDWAVRKEEWDSLKEQAEDESDEGQELEEGSRAGEEDATSTSGSSGQEDEGALLEDHIQTDKDVESASGDEVDDDEEGDDSGEEDRSEDQRGTLFVRNLPFSATDDSLQEHFGAFGAVRYARVVIDHETDRPRGTGFVCFFNADDAISCLKEARQLFLSQAPEQPRNAKQHHQQQHSILENTNSDPTGRFTLEGRVLQVTAAVSRTEATRLTVANRTALEARDRDKRRLYLLSEAAINQKRQPDVFAKLSTTDIKMREDSLRQRQTLIRNNPTLHLSLTRLSIRNLPRSFTSKLLKQLARQAVVAYVADVKTGKAKQLTKEELSRGGDDQADLERERKAKGKGIVRQAKIIFESGGDGAQPGAGGGGSSTNTSTKVPESSGAGRSRGYGFVEYASHRWALMGLRWMNGYLAKANAAANDGNRASKGFDERGKRLIVEFAIENAQVVARRREREVKDREKAVVAAKDGSAADVSNNKRKRKGGPSQEASGKGAASKENKKRKSHGSVGDGDGDDDDDDEVKEQRERVAQRQRIIGRKRMARKERGKK